jgi:hypothetical protein
MSYDYQKLFEKIIEVTDADASITQRMLVVIEECSRQKPHPDWKMFEHINFEADAAAIQNWLSSAFDTQEPESAVRGLWFGLVNLSDGNNTTADMYVGGSPHFDEGDIDWASELSAINECNYLNSVVLHEIYAKAYRDETGALGNDAEYPLALAYGTIAAVQSLRGDGLHVPSLSSARGAAAGFDSGDFLFLGTVEHGRYNPCIKAG